MKTNRHDRGSFFLFLSSSFLLKSKHNFSFELFHSLRIELTSELNLIGLCFHFVKLQGFYKNHLLCLRESSLGPQSIIFLPNTPHSSHLIHFHGSLQWKHLNFCFLSLFIDLSGHLNLKVQHEKVQFRHLVRFYHFHWCFFQFITWNLIIFLW